MIEQQNFFADITNQNDLRNYIPTDEAFARKLKNEVPEREIGTAEDLLKKSELFRLAIETYLGNKGESKAEFDIGGWDTKTEQILVVELNDNSIVILQKDAIGGNPVVKYLGMIHKDRDTFVVDNPKEYIPVTVKGSIVKISNIGEDSRDQYLIQPKDGILFAPNQTGKYGRITMEPATHRTSIDRSTVQNFNTTFSTLNQTNVVGLFPSNKF